MKKRSSLAAALPHLGFDGAYTRNVMRPVIFFRDASNDEVVQIEIGEENDYMVNLSLSQMLFAFGRVGRAIDAANYYLKWNEASLEAAAKDVEFATETDTGPALYGRASGITFRVTRSPFRSTTICTGSPIFKAPSAYV